MGGRPLFYGQFTRLSGAAPLVYVPTVSIAELTIRIRPIFIGRGLCWNDPLGDMNNQTARQMSGTLERVLEHFCGAVAPIHIDRSSCNARFTSAKEPVLA